MPRLCDVTLEESAVTSARVACSARRPSRARDSRILARESCRPGWAGGSSLACDTGRPSRACSTCSTCRTRSARITIETNEARRASDTSRTCCSSLSRGTRWTSRAGRPGSTLHTSVSSRPGWACFALDTRVTGLSSRAGRPLDSGIARRACRTRCTNCSGIASGSGRACWPNGAGNRGIGARLSGRASRPCRTRRTGRSRRTRLAGRSRSARRPRLSRLSIKADETCRASVTRSARRSCSPSRAGGASCTRNACGASASRSACVTRRTRRASRATDTLRPGNADIGDLNGGRGFREINGLSDRLTDDDGVGQITLSLLERPRTCPSAVAAPARRPAPSRGRSASDDRTAWQGALP